MRFSNTIILWLLLLITGVGNGQSYLLPNEELVYSFNTTNGKTMVLAKDKNDGYLIYRFGTPNKIELEFPEKTKASFDQFTYSYYLRGGGVQNEGMDLNYIKFTNGDYQYLIYDTYYAIGEESELGIKITHLKTKKTTDIKGDEKTQKGTLIDFRFNNLLKIEDLPEE